MARLTLGMVRDLASRERPWTIRLECVDPSTNTSKFWYATGRALHEMVECGWGRIGSKPQLKLVPFDKFDNKVDEKLNKGYDYADTSYIRMSPGNLAKLGGPLPSTSPQMPQNTPQKAPTPSAPSKGPLPTATHVNPSLPPPFGMIRWLKPSSGKKWEALDTNKQRLLDLPLESGSSLLRDFPSTISILA